MGKHRLRLVAPLALVLFFLAPAARAQEQQQQRAPQRARSQNGAAYRAAKERLVRKGRGFVRSYGASRWIPASKLKDMPATGGMRSRAFKRARLMSFYIPETRGGVAGFRVERLYGMSDMEAPETPELGPDGKDKVAAAYGSAVATLVDQHISQPKADRIHWKAIRELEKTPDATDPVASGRRGITAAVNGYDKWTRYQTPSSHQETEARRNGGGLTTESKQLLELFAPDSRLLSRRTVRKDGRIENIEWRASQRGPLAGIPLFVLVDGKSASASETVTSSLKDNRLARIGGSRTFGKGVGQQTTVLEDGGSVAVTLTTIQGPTSTYHGIGLDPDVSAEDLAARGRSLVLARGDLEAADGDPVILGAIAELRGGAR